MAIGKFMLESDHLDEQKHVTGHRVYPESSITNNRSNLLSEQRFTTTAQSVRVAAIDEEGVRVSQRPTEKNKSMQQNNHHSRMYRDFLRHPVYKRFLKRGASCPWEDIANYISKSKLPLAKELEAKGKYILFQSDRLGPGWGVTLAHQAVSVLVGMATNRPAFAAYCPPSSSRGGEDPFNVNGSLLTSPLLRPKLLLDERDVDNGDGYGDSFLKNLGYNVSQDVEYYQNFSKCYILEDFTLAWPLNKDSWGGALRSFPLSDQNSNKLLEQIEERGGKLKFLSSRVVNLSLESIMDDPAYNRLDHSYSGNPQIDEKQLLHPDDPIFVSSGSSYCDGLIFIADLMRADPHYREYALRMGARDSEFSAPMCALRMVASLPTHPVAKLLSDGLLSQMDENMWLLALHFRRGDWAMLQECADNGTNNCIRPESIGEDERDYRISINELEDMIKIVSMNVLPTLELQRPVKVFVATDTSLMRDIVSKYIPEAIMFSGFSSHTNVNDFDSDVRTAADFFAMAMADFCIRAMSSFSGMAFEMGGCEDIGPDSISKRDVRDGFSGSQIENSFRFLL